MASGAPDNNLIGAIIKGMYSGALKVVSTDADGNLIIKVKGDFGGVMTDVAVDADGNILVNLKAQDIGQIMNRPKYGAAKRVMASKAATASNTVSMFSVSGQGMIYGGYGTSLGLANQETDAYSIEVDGEELFKHSFKGMDEWKLNTLSSGALYLLENDTTNFRHCVGVMPGITFETSFEMKYTEVSGNTPTLAALINYALIA